MNIKSACLLLGLCHAGSAVALGLGELDMRSYLGQPLHASIRIIGANATTEADCFSLLPSEGGAVPPRAQLSLERTGNQVFLHVRTAHAIHDPFAQFVLTSDCEARLQRGYVVLLDPPPKVSSPPKQIEPQPIAEDNVPATSTVTISPAVPASDKRTPEKRAVKARPAASSRLRALAASASQSEQTDSAPRLVLSGRHGLQSTALSLRLDTNLPDLNRPPPQKLTPEELSDENTALTRKLAHLEAQLAALQKRNAEIETERAGGSGNTAPRPTDQSSQWPVYLLIVGLLAATGWLVFMLGSRSRKTSAAEKATWSPASEPESGMDTMTPDPWTRPTIEEAGSRKVPQKIIEYVSSAPEPTTEVKDDILDQAEVYVAHGHGDLAAHLLQEHLREAPDESPVPWLLLLDLLHREGDTEGYAAASAECRRHFNVNLSGHPVSQDSETSQGLEAYPHLLEQLVVIWGSPVTEDFFNDLIYDKRGGTRIGFDPGAYRDILMLRAISRDTQPLAA